MALPPIFLTERLKKSSAKYEGTRCRNAHDNQNGTLPSIRRRTHDILSYKFAQQGGCVRSMIS